MTKLTNGSCKSHNGTNGTNGTLIETKLKFVRNKFLDEDNDDVLFHLKLSKKKNDFKAMFGDVKFVCIGGTAKRMKDCAHFILNEMGLVPPNGSAELPDLTAHGHRYSMFKAGCVLCVNHGMGPASITILLHEIIKLLHYAEVHDPIIIRTGTCGSLHTPLGTVIISDAAVNDFCEPYFCTPICGKMVKQPVVVDQKVVAELLELSHKHLDFPVSTGKTMTNEHLYERFGDSEVICQFPTSIIWISFMPKYGRKGVKLKTANFIRGFVHGTASKSAVLCYGTDEQRDEYFEKLLANNVVNLDMESVALFSITHQVGIRAAVINVVVNTILSDNMVPPTAEELIDWERRPQRLIWEYVKNYLQRSEKESN